MPYFTWPRRPVRVSLADYRGAKAVVLFFYPKDGTAVCTKEACSFRDAYEDFVQAGAVVIGVSSDPVESHQAFASGHRLPFVLLADADGSLRKAFGVPKTLGLLPGRLRTSSTRTGLSGTRRVRSSRGSACCRSSRRSSTTRPELNACRTRWLGRSGHEIAVIASGISGPACSPAARRRKRGPCLRGRPPRRRAYEHGLRPRRSGSRMRRTPASWFSTNTRIPRRSIGATAFYEDGVNIARLSASPSASGCNHA